MQILNLSKYYFYRYIFRNKIKDEFFPKFSKLPKKHLKSLALLLLDENQMTGTNCEGFIDLLKHNNHLFVFNNWVGINEELAILLVDSYCTFAQTFK